MTALFNEMNRLGLRPLFLTLNNTAPASVADMSKTVDAFEKTVQPALAAFVTAVSKTTPIRSGDTLPADVKAKIDAAIPRTAYAKPKKPRKLLVIDACVANMSHNTIPHFNLAIELMAKHTGAFEAVFSNDLDNLRWPKIKELDAIYLNDTVGELFPDLEIRQSLLRYVREGGGVGGWHGSPWASRSWRGFGEMISAADAPHRIEPAYHQAGRSEESHQPGLRRSGPGAHRGVLPLPPRGPDRVLFARQRARAAEPRHGEVARGDASPTATADRSSRARTATMPSPGSRATARAASTTTRWATCRRP